MRVLVTAGGTRAPLDEVRWFGNVSTGRFGAQLVEAALLAGAQVVHLHGPGAEQPFQRRIDLGQDLDRQWAICRQEADRLAPHLPRYRAVPFVAPWDYGEHLERLLRGERFDIALLAAAVSDYAPAGQSGKIGSGADELVVRMKAVPKFIARAKEWAPHIFLVGFKLLVGAEAGELIDAAVRSGRASRSDVTVANDLRSLQAGDHTIYLVREGQAPEVYRQADEPARRLVERVFDWYRAERGAGGSASVPSHTGQAE